MRVKWLRTALRDLDEIAEYITEDSPSAADRVVAKVSESIGGLAKRWDVLRVFTVLANWL